jgi:hypothetical protein
MANVMTEPPESGKRRFNEAQQKAVRRKRVKRPEIIRMLNELPNVIPRSSNGRELPAERK